VDGVGSAVFPNAASPSHSVCYEVSSVAGYKNNREGLWGCFKSKMFKATDITMIDNVMGVVL